MPMPFDATATSSTANGTTKPEDCSIKAETVNRGQFVASSITRPRCSRIAPNSTVPPQPVSLAAGDPLPRLVYGIGASHMPALNLWINESVHDSVGAGE